MADAREIKSYDLVQPIGETLSVVKVCDSGCNHDDCFSTRV